MPRKKRLWPRSVTEIWWSTITRAQLDAQLDHYMTALPRHFSFVETQHSKCRLSNVDTVFLTVKVVLQFVERLSDLKLEESRLICSVCDIVSVQ